MNTRIHVLADGGTAPARAGSLQSHTVSPAGLRQ